MGFNMLFYIFFGTNLLNGGPVPVAVFCLFQCFVEKEYQTESKWNKTFAMIFLGPEDTQETWSTSQRSFEAATRVEGAPPTLWAPRGSPDLDLPPIYTLIP